MAIALPQCRGLIKVVRVANPEGRYGPAAKPTAINPKRIFHKPELKEVNSKARPEAKLEKIIVRRWVRRDEINPEANNVVKYPTEIKRKSEPASALLKARSDLTLGISGARTMRDKKLTKKMEVRSKSAGSRVKNVSRVWGPVSSTSGGGELVVIFESCLQITYLYDRRV